MMQEWTPSIWLLRSRPFEAKQAPASRALLANGAAGSDPVRKGVNCRLCNGPRSVNPSLASLPFIFCVIHIAEVTLLYGVSAKLPPDGV
jgi:hypothetical protein